MIMLHYMINYIILICIFISLYFELLLSQYCEESAYYPPNVEYIVHKGCLIFWSSDFLCLENSPIYAADFSILQIGIQVSASSIKACVFLQIIFSFSFLISTCFLRYAECSFLSYLNLLIVFLPFKTFVNLFIDILWNSFLRRLSVVLVSV